MKRCEEGPSDVEAKGGEIRGESGGPPRVCAIAGSLKVAKKLLVHATLVLENRHVFMRVWPGSNGTDIRT